MIIIDNSSHVPVSEQIVDKITILILSGVLKERERLPAIRKLASTLVVNPNTVRKAYVKLEEMGLVRCDDTVGYFVSEDMEQVKKQEVDKLYGQFLSTVDLLRNLGESLEDIQNRMKKERGES